MLASTSQASQARQEPQQSLHDRAVTLVAALRGLDVADLRETYLKAADSIADRVEIPDYVKIAGQTQRVQVTSAVVLLADDSTARRRVYPWIDHLAAGHAAFEKAF